MKFARTSWTSLLIFRALFVALLVAWKFYDVEQAGNAFQFIVWTAAIVGMVNGYAPTNPSRTIVPYTVAQDHVANLFAVAITLALAWFGDFVLATFWMIGAAAQSMYRDQFDANGKFIAKEAA